MRRREFIAGLSSAAAWPLAAPAQHSGKPVHIGVLPLGSASSRYDQFLVEAFREGLRDVGLAEGRQ